MTNSNKKSPRQTRSSQTSRLHLCFCYVDPCCFGCVFGTLGLWDSWGQYSCWFRGTLLDKRDSLLGKLVLDTIRLVLEFMETTLCKGLESVNKQKGAGNLH